MADSFLCTFYVLDTALDYLGFPGGSNGKESACIVRDPGSISDRKANRSSNMIPGEQ